MHLRIAVKRTFRCVTEGLEIMLIGITRQEFLKLSALRFAAFRLARYTGKGRFGRPDAPLGCQGCDLLSFATSDLVRLSPIYVIKATNNMQYDGCVFRAPTEFAGV